ncbi:recombinational DNA repair protein (RecE pathway) [Flavobacterium sp. ALJ2]|uniref:recombinational DNA repair protein (RecE pathway) n=1 Tax=Flavobacterium sp. ALJ2 TaxID=2786960 RepID=UPI00189D0340|nr:recombinational DNA repair protein (RecE pathway) [Flavobacterium sp. ALJ2]MBF7090491.1 recombinational DNA repair protein (RecE pathway) [Flavobacterium sp. ALJ2]
MSTEIKTAETPKATLATTQPSQSERFTNAVMKEFSSNNGAVTLTPFQKKLCQNYFIKVDQTLKDNEKKRLAKTEQYRDALAFTWENVNMAKLAIDVIAYSSVELDPTQPNHISIVPYKNTANNKFDMGFLIGYRGMEIKAKKYGLEVPSDVVYELVYSTDKFKQFKKDKNNPVESYSLEITNDFNRGDVVGGFWYHEFKENPEKNKIKVFSLKDIEKRKPKYASAEFWGGEKDIWENKKKVGTEKIDGWFEEMAIKTISRNAYNAITIDSKKIDDNYLAILQKENEMNDSIIQNQIDANANKEPLDFEDAEIVDDKALEIAGVTYQQETSEQNFEQSVQQTNNLEEAAEPGPNF